MAMSHMHAEGLQGPIHLVPTTSASKFTSQATALPHVLSGRTCIHQKHDEDLLALRIWAKKLFALRASRHGAAAERDCLRLMPVRARERVRERVVSMIVKCQKAEQAGVESVLLR